MKKTDLNSGLGTSVPHWKHPISKFPSIIHLWKSAFPQTVENRKVTIPVSLKFCWYLQKLLSVSTPQFYPKTFRGQSLKSGLVHPVHVLAPNLHRHQQERNLIPHLVHIEASGKPDFSTSWSGLNPWRINKHTCRIK